MKRIAKHTLIMPLLILASGLFIAFGTSDALGVEFGLNQINFLGATYDSGTDATTYSYQVIAAWSDSLNYWVLALNPDCFGAGHIIDASESYQYVNPDVATGITGIKFDQPYGPGETRIVWFRIQGNTITEAVRVVVRQGCSNWFREIEGPECGGQPGPPPPEGEGMSPGYWKNQLAIFLGNKGGKLKEPDVWIYAENHGYTAEDAYAILSVKKGSPVDHLHKQLLAAKLSTAAGYLSNMDELLEWGQDMVAQLLANPEAFTDQEILDAKDLFEALHD